MQVILDKRGKSGTYFKLENTFPVIDAIENAENIFRKSEPPNRPEIL